MIYDDESCDFTQYNNMMEKSGVQFPIEIAYYHAKVLTELAIH